MKEKLIDLTRFLFLRDNAFHLEFWGFAENDLKNLLNPDHQSLVLSDLNETYKFYFDLFNSLVHRINQIKPKLFELNLEECTEKNYKTKSSLDPHICTSLKQRFIRAAVPKMEAYAKEVHYKETRIKIPNVLNWKSVFRWIVDWVKQEKLRVIGITALAGVGTAVLLGVFGAVIPGFQAALSLIFAVSIVNSLLITSAIGLAVSGILAFAFTLFHIYLAARHYQASLKPVAEKFSFHFELHESHMHSERENSFWADESSSYSNKISTDPNEFKYKLKTIPVDELPDEDDSFSSASQNTSSPQDESSSLNGCTDTSTSETYSPIMKLSFTCTPETD